VTPGLIYVTGGARSGKSRFAEALVRRADERVSYLATAQASDAEMTERTLRHRHDRPADWHTLEEPLELAAMLTGLERVALLDCLSLWVSNLMRRGDPDELILQATDALIEAQAVRRSPLIAVSNEVGFSIVPGDALARRYRDTLGWVNQRFAAASDEAWLLVSGLPVRLK
jgi:adenosylcobinamide kinase / adenosylcobinamide-phosphate guanylyltransferase